jgi:hypothetical protein
MLDVVPLWTALRETLSLLCFRGLPVLAVLLGSGHLRIAAKLWLVAASVALVVAPRAWELIWLPGIALAYAYFAVVACVAPAAVRALRRGWLTPALLFAGCFAAFLWLPGWLLPPRARGAGLIIGFDLVLAGYSYVLDVARSREEPDVRRCLYFLLVNPVLVYAQRGEHVSPPRLHAGGLLRSALGLAALFGATLVSCLLVSVTTVNDPLAAAAVEPAAMITAAAGRFLAEYMRHSGLASLQIGLMRQLGHVIPERYDFPLLARDPLDFWRRWNTYVGAWIQRYVFSPAALRWGRGALRSRPAAAKSAALLLAFVTVGLLHDAYHYCAGAGLELRATRFFLACAALGLGWAGCRALARTSGEYARAWRSAAALAARAPLWAGLLSLFAWFVR